MGKNEHAHSYFLGTRFLTWEGSATSDNASDEEIGVVTHCNHGITCTVNERHKSMCLLFNTLLAVRVLYWFQSLNFSSYDRNRDISRCCELITYTVRHSRRF